MTSIKPMEQGKITKAITQTINLKDNYTPALNRIRVETFKFKKEVVDLQKVIEHSFGKTFKMQINTKSACKELKNVEKGFGKVATYLNRPLGRVKIDTQSACKKLEDVTAALKETSHNVVPGSSTNENEEGVNKKKASTGIKGFSSRLKTLGKMAVSPVVKIKDMASGAIGRIGGKLKSLSKLKTVVGKTLGEALSSGMALEKQQVVMEQIVGSGNKGKKPAEIKNMSANYVKDLREGATRSPFSSNEVVEAGTAALSATGGDTKEAMTLVKVAQDMAARTPGKKLSDAMEALTNAKDGDMKQLKDFGVEAPKGKTNFKDLMNKQIKPQFAGGSAELSQTGSGLLNTIKEKAGNTMQDQGLKMVEKMKPLLQEVIALMESPIFTSISETISNAIGKIGDDIIFVVNMVKDNMPKIQAFLAPLMEQYLPVMQEAFTTTRDIVGQVWGGLVTVFSESMPIIQPLFEMIINSASLIWETIEMVVPKIMEKIQGLWDFIQPFIAPIGNFIGGISDKIGEFAKWMGAKNDEGKRTKGVDGSHKNGLKQVPFDGYIARLHKGEAVIPANQNPYRQGSSAGMDTSKASKGVVIEKLADTFVVREEADIDKIANRLVNKLQKTAINMA